MPVCIAGMHRSAIPDVRVIRFARFVDKRGYFAESFRRSDLASSARSRRS